MSAVMDPMYRPLGLESDVSNHNFSGARNPDDLLWVQFSIKPMPDNAATMQQGRPIFRDETWIEIRVPGNNLLTIERPADDIDKRRFPRHWSYFLQTHNPDGQNIGTPLSQWPLLRPSQIEELRALKFYTVEQIAFSSDEQIGHIGMLAGMAPMAFRERAKLYLESAKQSTEAVQQAEEIKRRDEQISTLKEAQAESERKHAQEMAELRALISAATAPRARGRPRKHVSTE